MNRQQIIAHYQTNPALSVLVVGAGINGIGTFRDLALQGVDVLLVDRADFCSGASAASTRMAHGGIRYLENGEFRLVRESLLERNRLLVNAPHAVKPLLFTIPVYSRFSGLLNAPLKFLGLLKRPSERGAVVIRLGLLMYDWLTRRSRITPTHRMLSRAEALRRHAPLNPTILGAATYYDALMPQAERIGLELVLDAETGLSQAHALNYVSLVGSAGRSVTLRDELTGALFEVQPRLLINAAGAWIDRVNQAMQRPTRFIGGTKGSHIIVRHPELLQALNGSAIYFENRDGRMCILAPFFDHIIIGSTDIRIEDPDTAVCDDNEIAYFLEVSRQVLPGIHIDRSQIVYHFSGVRPLPNSEVEFAGMISRDHSIRVVDTDDTVAFPIYSLVGGKWTTFRAFAEQVTDQALAFLERTRRASTQDLAIGGGSDYPRQPGAADAFLKRLETAYAVPADRLRTLFERYGTRADALAAFIAAGADAPLRSQPDYSRREILFLAEREKVAHLDDVVLRRTLLGLLGRADGAALTELAEILGGALGWSADDSRREVERCAALLRTRHGVPADKLRLPDVMTG